jgi:hypothetical protein
MPLDLRLEIILNATPARIPQSVDNQWLSLLDRGQ